MDNIKLNEIVTISLILLILILILSFTFTKPGIDNSKNKIVDQNNNTNSCDDVDDYLKEICKLRNKKCIDDSCFYQKARLDLNLTLCEKIINNTLMAGCMAAIKYDTIYQDSVIENNVSKCSIFDDEENQLACRDNYYYVNSVNKNNNSFCENISDEVLRNECYN